MKPALVVSERDNVATALEPLEPGRRLEIHGTIVEVGEHIPPGHKVALVALRPGQTVIKYGSAIGTATAYIAAGAHVHTHNVASGRGRGDLGSVAPDVGAGLPPSHEASADRRSLGGGGQPGPAIQGPSTEGRLAEPPDEHE